MALTLRSPAFEDGARIPEKYARDHGNVSPPLEWRGAPEGTKSFVLVVEDPDAPRGTFRHWAAYDLPPDRTQLKEGAGRRGSDLKHGANDFGNANYDGPQPPEGHGTHHYHFRIAALDIDHLGAGPAQRAAEVWATAQAHMLDQAEIVGTYDR